MTKLNDTQLILLSAAAARDDGGVYPLPAPLADASARASKAVTTLLKGGLVEERETSDGCCQSNAHSSPHDGAVALCAAA
jgi:hypothetical protein